jgi:hypothetical protein
MRVIHVKVFDHLDLDLGRLGLRRDQDGEILGVAESDFVSVLIDVGHLETISRHLERLRDCSSQFINRLFAFEVDQSDLLVECNLENHPSYEMFIYPPPLKTTLNPPYR